MTDSATTEMPTYTVKELNGSNGRIQIYDANAAMDAHRGWVYGSFIETSNGQSLGDAPFEIKMGALAAGESRDQWPESAPGICVTVINSGRMRYAFKPNGESETVEIEVGAGEVVIWDNSVPHIWTVLEDLNYVTVRNLK